MSDSRDSEQIRARSGAPARKITRRNWLRVAGAGGIAALAGCSGDGDGGDDSGDGDNGTSTGDSSGVTTIEFWRWPHSTDPSNDGEDAIVEAFNEGPGADEGIEVEQVTNPFGDHNQKLRTAIGGNDAPDVAWTWPQQLYDYSGRSRSEIEENAPYAYIDEYLEEGFTDQYFEQAVNYQETRWEGMVGLPFISGVEPGLMYVHTDAWEEAGLGDIPDGHWSYEEYLEAAEQINGTEVNGTTVSGVGAGLSDAVSADQWDNFLSVMSRTAGSHVGAGYQNQDDEYVMTLASDPELEAWNAIIGTPLENGWTNNVMAHERDGIQDPFVEGQIGLLGHSTFSRVEFSEDADFNWDIIEWPTKNGEDMGMYLASGWDVMFTPFSEDVGGNPEAAAEFIKFRCNAENQYEWFNVSSQTVPNRESYEMMQEEGVSDFVKESGGLEVMHRVNDAMQVYPDQMEAIKERYPDVATTDSGIPIVDMPTSIGDGRVHQAVGGALERLAQSQNQNARQELTTAEEEWANIIEQQEDLAVDQDSIGYNKPEPQAGPL